MTTTTGESLLRAILEDPYDDDVRLVYSDWLEENGQQDRAEFIRVELQVDKLRSQCLCGRCVKEGSGRQHHNGKCVLDMHENKPLKMRQIQLSGLGFSWWILPEHFPETISQWSWQWRRGFTFRIHLPCEEFLNHAKELFSLHPITEVRLIDKNPLVAIQHHFEGPKRGTEERIYYWRAFRPIRKKEIPNSSYNIPAEIVQIEKSRYAKGVGRSPVFFTLLEAEKWLSQQCVNYGRGLVNLPPLDFTKDKTK